MDCKAVVIGTTPGTSLSVDGHVDVGADGTVTLFVPVKIASGTSASDLTLEGTLAGDAADRRVDAKLTGGTVSLDDLRLVAGPLAAFGGGVPGAEAARRVDREPFWGGLSGRLVLSFDHLKAANREFSEVTGRIDSDGGMLRLRNGRGVLPPHNLAKLEGTIKFDPAAEQPYALASTAEVSDIDATKLFADPRFGRAPALEGHFSVSADFSGEGANLRDLVAGARREYRLKSAGGILRILKTSVAEAIPEAPAKGDGHARKGRFCRGLDLRVEERVGQGGQQSGQQERRGGARLHLHSRGDRLRRNHGDRPPGARPQDSPA